MMTTSESIFPWQDAYTVGMPEIDNQHKGLVRLINQLHSAMMEGNGKAALAGILADLIRYTQSHFAYEEAMMRKLGYSGAAEHSAEHQRLTAQVLELRDKFQSGRLAISNEVMRFLKDWLAGHILSRDQAYARELKGKK